MAYAQGRLYLARLWMGLYVSTLFTINGQPAWDEEDAIDECDDALRSAACDEVLRPAFEALRAKALAVT